MGFQGLGFRVWGVGCGVSGLGVLGFDESFVEGVVGSYSASRLRVLLASLTWGCMGFSSTHGGNRDFLHWY